MHARSPIHSEWGCCTVWVARKMRRLVHHALSWPWVPNCRSSFLLLYKWQGVELLILLPRSSLSWDRNCLPSPLIFKTHPTTLPIMASGGEHGHRPYGGNPHHDAHQPPSHRVGTDVSSGRVSSSARCVSTLCQCLCGLVPLL
jgi:hypothetical protein